MVTWKPVTGWPYEVSDHGYVRRVGGSMALTPMWTGRKRKQYATVRLCDGAAQVSVKVHRLVCEIFNGPPPEGAIACHRDDDTRNNAASNLYWGSWQDNARDAGRRKPTAVVVAEIRRRRLSGERGVALAREFGISQQLVCDIVKGRCYAYV